MESEITKGDIVPPGMEGFLALPLGIGLGDFSVVGATLERLRDQGCPDIEGYLAAQPQEAKILLSSVRALWFNDAGRILFGSRRGPVEGSRLAECVGAEGVTAFRRIVEGLFSGEPHVDTAIIFSPQEGTRVPLKVRASWLDRRKPSWSAVVLSFEPVRKGRAKAGGDAGFDDLLGGRRLFKTMTLGLAVFEAVFAADGGPQDVRFLSLNPAFERMTGLEREEVMGLKSLDVVPGMRSDWVAELCAVARTGKPAAPARAVEFQGRFFEARAYRPEPGLVALLLQDMTEAIRDLKALGDREDLFRKVLATTAEGFFIVDEAGRFLDVNDAYCDLMGYRREEFLAMTVLDQAAAVEPGQVPGRLGLIKERGSQRFETVHRRKDGRLLDVEISSSYLADADGQGRFITFCRDITERKRTERRLREQDERLSLALRGTGAGIWDWDIAAGDMMVDANWGRILGREVGSFRSFRKSEWDGLCNPEDSRDSEAAFLAHFTGEAPRYECELRMRHQSGAWVWVRNQGEVVERDPQGRPLRVIGLMFDIGAQKEAESRLRTTIAEKESLLSELYHRTKNSMQLINAMLELKKQELGDTSVSAAFDDIQNKILAMALVQEKLYQADTLSSIDLGSYVNDLMDLLASEMSFEGKRINFSASGEAVEVTADIAIPCGLIVSELVGNSLSHAFSAQEGGSISVSVYKDATGEIHIEEWDDGVGLPQGFDPRRGGRVGLRTVIGIGEEQLHGLVSFGDRASGFSCKLKFRDVYYPRRV